MAQPPAYLRDADFTKNHGSVQNDSLLNAELDDVSASVNAIRDNLAMLQDDDGGLKEGIVTKDNFTQQAYADLVDDVTAGIQATVDLIQEAAEQAQQAADDSAASAVTASSLVERAEQAAVDSAQNAADAAQTVEDIQVALPSTIQAQLDETVSEEVRRQIADAAYDERIEQNLTIVNNAIDTIPQIVENAVNSSDIPGQVEDEVDAKLTQAIVDGMTEALGYTPADAADVAGKQNLFLVNAKDYGATGDGVTDDTSALAEAVAAGSPVFLPSGTYVSGVIPRFLSSTFAGNGVISRDGNSIYPNDANVTRITNFYVSPTGGGDGLSVNSPAKLADVVAYLQRISPLKGRYVVHLAAGTYPAFSLYRIAALRQDGLVFEGGAVSQSGTDKSAWVWSTVFSGSTAFFTGDVPGVTFRNIHFLADGSSSSQGLAVSYGVRYLLVDTCKVSGFMMRGINCQSVTFMQVNNSLVDGGGSATYGIMCYSSRLSTNQGSNTRNQIQGCTVGLAAWGGKSYIHNDFNDFIGCTYAVQSMYSAHVVSGSATASNVQTTYTDCTTNHLLSLAGNVSDSAADNSIVQFGLFNNQTDTSYRIRQGLFNTSDGSITFGESGVYSVNPSWTVNLNAGTDLLNTARGNFSGAQKYAVFYDNGASSNPRVVSAGNTTAGVVFAKASDGTVVSSLDANVSTGQTNIRLRENNALIVKASFRAASFSPFTTGGYSLGTDTFKWSGVYANNLYSDSGTVSTSDERLKDNISDISDDVLDAWGDVSLKVFQFKDSIEQKGQDARLHMGVVAQQVKSAFDSKGIDAFRYGLLCYDKWDDQFEDVEVIDKDEVIDVDGNIVQEQESHLEQRQVQAAGDRYSIRYEEALILEAAYQRRRADRIEARLKDIEERIG